jgi:hypothetical protein
LLVTPVAVFVTPNRASFTTAPLGSVTIPRTDPVIVWADTVNVLANRATQHIAITAPKPYTDNFLRKYVERKLSIVFSPAD